MSFGAVVALGLVVSAPACGRTTDERKAESALPSANVEAPGPAPASTPPASPGGRPNAATAPPAAPEAKGDPIETIDGTLRVDRSDPLNGRIVGPRSVVFPPTCAPGTEATCGEVAKLAGNGAFSLVKKWDTTANTLLLFQSDLGGGNACNGGPMFFVAIARGAAPRYSKVLDFCGGPTPKLDESAAQVRLSWPAHAPNRGSGKIPGEQWELDRTTLELTKRR